MKASTQKIVKRVCIVLAILLSIAMVVHVDLAMWFHNQTSSNSAPAWVNIFLAVPYLVLLNVLNLVWQLIQYIPTENRATRVCMLLKVLLLVAMTIHAGVAMWIESLTFGTSGLLLVFIYYAVIYLVPLVVIDLVWWGMRIGKFVSTEA